MSYTLGIQPTRVTDTAEFSLGTIAFDHAGCGYIYLEADSAIAAGFTVIVHADGGCDEVGSTNGANGTGIGKLVAVAPEVAIASGQFFWGCVLAPAIAGKRAMLADSCLAHTRLKPLCDTASAGILDDDEDSAMYIHGLTAAVAGDASTGSLEVVNICWPHVAWDDIEAG